MTIFARIINGEVPCDKVYEDERVMAFKDIAPQAPIHLLIVPKKPWKNLQEIPESELSIVSHIAKVAQELADEFEISEGYRLLTNCGQSAGQTVFHLHFHLLGGRVLHELG